MAPDDIRRSIRGFFSDTVAYRRSAEPSDSQSLIATGLLDSLAMLSLIAFIEQTFDTCVGDDDVEPENFGSIDSLTAFVARKLGSAKNQAA
jgi:acyl carrier protein